MLTNELQSKENKIKDLALVQNAALSIEII